MCDSEVLFRLRGWAISQKNKHQMMQTKTKVWISLITFTISVHNTEKAFNSINKTLFMRKCSNLKATQIALLTEEKICVTFPPQFKNVPVTYRGRTNDLQKNYITIQSGQNSSWKVLKREYEVFNFIMIFMILLTFFLPLFFTTLSINTNVANLSQHKNKTTLII